VAPPARTLRHESEHGSWELVVRDPARELRGIVSRYEGYEEYASPSLVLRQEVPSVHVPLILNFGSRWRVGTESDGAPEIRDSFVAGLHERSSFVAAEGAARCVQVDFTPIGAHLFLGVPMQELANRVLDLEDVFPEGRDLVPRLEDTSSWEERFRLLDAVIRARVAEARRPPPEILWAWRALEHSGGAVPVGTLAEKVGRSRRHLLAGFRDYVGLSPKTAARVIRFGRAVALLQDDPHPSFAELAYECGYFDQAHLNRDFRAFAGTTPGEFVRRMLPGGGVLAA
jgi:AraC-like DNA-binding protein